jgi:hypothetical protein
MVEGMVHLVYPLYLPKFHPYRTAHGPILFVCHTLGHPYPCQVWLIALFPHFHDFHSNPNRMHDSFGSDTSVPLG